MSSSRAVFTLCLLLSAQLLLAVCAPGLVVCEEAEGNQTLELSLSGCCDERYDAHVEAGWEPSDGCGGCEDAALQLQLQREEHDAPRVPAPLLALVADEHAPVPPPAVRARAPRAPPPRPQLASLTTVVLRL